MKSIVTTDETHKKYKILAAVHDKTISELLDEAVELLIEKYNTERENSNESTN